GRPPHHFEPVLRGRDAGALQRRIARGHEHDPIERKRLAQLLGQPQMCVVDRIERAAENAQLHSRTVPSPNAVDFCVVSPSRPIGPCQCSFVVETPTSAPRPSWKPSAKRVLAFTNTELEFTRRTNSRARATSCVTIVSVWFEPKRRMCSIAWSMESTMRTDM